MLNICFQKCQKTKNRATFVVLKKAKIGLKIGEFYTDIISKEIAPKR